VEAFVDDMRAYRSPAVPRGEARPPSGRRADKNTTTAAATGEQGRPQGRRTRFVVRRIKKPAAGS